MISEASAVSTGRSFEEKAYRGGNLLAIGNRDRERPCGCYGPEGKRRHLVGALVVILTHWSVFIHKFQPRTSRSCVRRSANANDLLYKDSSAPSARVQDELGRSRKAGINGFSGNMPRLSSYFIFSSVALLEERSG